MWLYAPNMLREHFWPVIKRQVSFMSFEVPNVLATFQLYSTHLYTYTHQTHLKILFTVLYVQTLWNIRSNIYQQAKS